MNINLNNVENSTNKDATGGYVGLTLFKINFKNVLNTFTSFFTNSNTAARTYTFQDRNGVIADDTDLAGKTDNATATTGAVISFATNQVYNSPVAPSIANLTDNLTGAKIGVVQKIYHNHSVAPTVPAGWVLIGSGTYTVSTLNIIYAEFVSGTRVEYWIVK